MKTNNNSSSVVWAVILIALGTLMIFDNFNMYNFEFPWEFVTWKLIFVFIAFNQLFKGKVFSSIFWGIISFFLFFPSYFNQFSVNSLFELWPLLLIGLGIDMIIKKKKSYY